MNKTTDYICKKYNIDLKKKSPFLIECGRWEELPKLFNELGFKEIAEIGVFKGEYAENLFNYIPSLHLYCIDPWKIYDDYKEFRNQKFLNDCYKETKERLIGKNAVIIRKQSMKAVKDFEDNSLDAVFIDGNHEFQFVTNDIAEWGKKVKIGGIIAGHDFSRSSRKFIHVKDVVQGWCYSHKIHPWFVLLGNDHTSFMWIKE